MNKWRMSMKVGSRGDNLWPQFHELGVAAMTYPPVIQIDFNNYSTDNRPPRWDELSRSQQGSLNALAYNVKKGDVIYVKDGGELVSEGLVLSEYYYDDSRDVIDKYDDIWPHRIKVKWIDSFPILPIKLGAEQHTLLLLNEERITLIDRALKPFGDYRHINETRETYEEQILLYGEGQLFREEQYLRKRNRELIIKKKNTSNYTCEVCGLNFESKYGAIGRNFIEAHHLISIANGARVSSLDDIALVCPNCHAMLHKKNPPYTIDELRRIIETKCEMNTKPSNMR